MTTTLAALRDLINVPLDTLPSVRLAALTEAEIERYVLLALAEEGVVPWAGPVPTPPSPVASMADMTDYYRVAGLMFATRQEAETVAGVLSTMKRFTTTYANGRWSGPMMAVPVDPSTDMAVETVRVLNERRAAEKQMEILSLDEQTKQYEKDRREFERVRSAVSTTSELVRGKVNAARAERAESDEVRRLYAHYLDLAALNVATARRFLLVARPNAELLAPDVFSDDVPPPPARAMRLTHDDAPAMRDDPEF